MLSQLAEDDPCRAALFTAATAALPPESPKTDYARLLTRQWRSLAWPLIDGAVTKLVNCIPDERSKVRTSSTISNSLGAISFNDDRDYQRFDRRHILQFVEPRKAAVLKENRPALATALEKFPEFRLSRKASD